MPPPTRPSAAPTSRRRRPRGLLATALPALALVAVLGACGADPEVAEPGDAAPQSPPTTPTTPTTPTAPTQAPSSSATTQQPAPPPSTATAQGVPEDFSAELTVAYDDGAGTAQTYDLTCDGARAGGTAADPAAACAAVAGAGGAEAFAVAPGDVQCAQVFGGPQTAVVTGTVQDEPVSADLARADGCQVDRWDGLVPLVPAAGA